MPLNPEQTIDLLLRGAGLGLLSLLALRLLQPPRSANRLLCLGLGLCIGGYLITSGGFDSQMPLLLRLPQLMLATLAPAMFWLFAQALFNDELRWHWLHALPPLLLGAMPLAWLLSLGDPDTRKGLELSQHLLASLLMIHVLWLTWRDHRSDLLPQRRVLRLWLGPGIGLYILTVLTVEVIHPAGDVPGWLSLLNLLGIFLVTLWLSLRLEDLLELLAPAHSKKTRVNASSIFNLAAENQTEKEKDSSDQPALQRLHMAMQDEQLWRRETLSVTELAKHLGLAEYRLRRLINGALGQRNFNSYLNQFRISAACEQLADPARRRLPILSIALDVGFASIGPFNRAFKAQLGITPSEFRREKLGES
mgnify:CR=1 FL=1